MKQNWLKTFKANDETKKKTNAFQESAKFIQETSQLRQLYLLNDHGELIGYKLKSLFHIYPACLEGGILTYHIISNDRVDWHK